MVVFEFVVVAFSIYHGVAIPRQNTPIEFDGNGTAGGAIQHRRNAVRQTATTGTVEAISIKSGATYPRGLSVSTLGHRVTSG